MLTWMLRTYFRHHLKPEIYGHGLIGMLRQGMMEVPAATLCCVGTPLAVMIFWPIHYYKLEKSGRDKKRFMFRWSVYRPDDPRLDFMMLSPKTEADRKQLRAKTT